MADQRRHPRFDGAGLDVRLKVDGSVHDEAVIENVSLGGALIALRGSCSTGKNVLLELDGGVRVVGRVIAVLPRGHGRALPGLRVRFNPASAACTAKLYSVIRRLPEEGSFAAAPTEAFEFHSIELDLTQDDDFSEEVPIDLVDVIEDEPTVIDAMARRIADLERQLATVRRNARTLEEVLVPAVLSH